MDINHHQIKKREWKFPPSFLDIHFFTCPLFATTGCFTALLAITLLAGPTLLSTGGLREGDLGPTIGTDSSNFFAIINNFNSFNNLLSKV